MSVRREIGGVLTSYIARTSAMLSSSNGRRHEIPALLTNPTNFRPSFSSSAATETAAAMHCASSTTSTMTGRNVGRSFFNFSASKVFLTPAKTVNLCQCRWMQEREQAAQACSLVWMPTTTQTHTHQYSWHVGAMLILLRPRQPKVITPPPFP